MPSETAPLADVLAENNRPVDAAGMRRAAETLAARDRVRGDRTALLERIRAHAPTTA